MKLIDKAKAKLRTINWGDLAIQAVAKLLPILAKQLAKRRQKPPSPPGPTATTPVT